MTSQTVPVTYERDTDFVRAAARHRDGRLTTATLYSTGPNTLVPGDTVYLFQCPADEGYSRLLAVSVPNDLVIDRDMDGVRHMFLQRDAALDTGAPWWMRPIGVAPADLPVARLAADIRPATVAGRPSALGHDLFG